MIAIVLALLGLYLAVAVYQAVLKPLPRGLSLAGEPQTVDAAAVEFLADVTYAEAGQRVSQQVIYDRVLELVNGAEEFVLADLFLFNDYLGVERDVHRRLSLEVAQALVGRKRSRPGLHVVVITDPVNGAYGGSDTRPLQMLREAGIPVVFTDLARLRDSNPVYSAFWRLAVQWFGCSPGGWLPHPFARDAGGVGLRSWLALLNFRANHRKLIVADESAPDGGRRMATIVMSANPHDGSSGHGNAAVLVHGGGLWRDAVRSEQAVLDLSGARLDLEAGLPGWARVAVPAAPDGEAHRVTVRLLTEGAIRRELVAQLAGTASGDTIDLAMFYLSERHVVDALVAAAGRGVTVRLLLDPNRDAFGYRKDGVPNRPVAAELLARGGGRIEVRWYDTHGEQFHTKVVLIRKAHGAVLLAGSANLTRRNIGDLNLETDVEVTGDRESPPLAAAADTIEGLWTNRDHAYSLPYEAYRDDSRLRYWRYRLQERSGLATF